MSLADLPRELICEILSWLDYKSLSNMSQTSHRYNCLASDRLVWRALYSRTFSPGREPVTDHAQEYSNRIRALREFIVRGTNDYTASLVRKTFSEMSQQNARLLFEFIEKSDLCLAEIVFQCQGYAYSSRKSIMSQRLSREIIHSVVTRHKDRTQRDPRSQVYLLRMLLARHTGLKACYEHPGIFMFSAQLIIYDSLANPLFHFPPLLQGERAASTRYNLRSRSNSGGGPASSVPPQSDTGNNFIGAKGPVINWGVVETIYSLIKMYRDRMSEAIPNFLQARDDYETEVPMQACMFDADLSGNWTGLYGYLDFRELELLDESRQFSPDYFDGIQNLLIYPEQPYDEATMGNDHFSGHDNNSDFDEPGFDLESEPTNHDDPGCGRTMFRFTADGTSQHGHFHIHGSTYEIPGMEKGFKLVRFDQMYNDDGLMPWIMSGVCIPSIGIVGRWRDRTEPVGQGVEGPYVLWRDRVRDRVDQDQDVAEDERRRRDHEESEDEHLPPLPVYRLKRPNHDLSYIVIEERSRLHP